MNAVESLRYFIPELALLATGFLVLILDLFLREKKWLGYVTLLGIGVASSMLRPYSPGIRLFHGYFLLDFYSAFFALLALAILFITVLLAMSYKGIPPKQEGELYALLSFVGLGLILMASSENLLMIFLSIEFVSLTSYVLTGFQKQDRSSNEAALKYLLFGSVASGVMVYGMSLIFGLTGSIELGAIREAVDPSGLNHLLLIGLVLMLVGFAFKISAAPFHMWAPDVYTGAPTPITAFLTVGPKALGFAVLIRVLLGAFSPLINQWSNLLAVMAALTMTIGNVVAVSQTNIKRLLAYSSIAQAGYMLMGVAAFTELGLSGVLVYLVAYALTNLGAFAAVILTANHYGTDDIRSYAGLARKSPAVAAALTVFFISLAGIPPLAGYIGKFFVFAGAIQTRFYLLAVFAAVYCAVAVFYYFKVVKEMY
ncbi:MAG: NADH-quinone oxidoreductase subunit N, partial [Candidatus Omnitrophica bacterium]|nr:NADH-quinone oxidoreductase subunit N [Candidatus Omnitrophota bacterium]